MPTSINGDDVLDFFEHLDTEFSKSKEAFLYSLRRLPAAKTIVINLGLSSLTYDTGFYNIRSLRNFIADIAELINSDSRKRIVIVVSDSINNTKQQYLALQDIKKSKKKSDSRSANSDATIESLTTDSRLYSALISMVHSDVVNLFYDGFSNYNLRAIGFSISSNDADVVGELKRFYKSIESVAFKSMDDAQKIEAIKELIHSNRNITQNTGFKSLTQKTSDTIKGLFKAYPRTIPIIMEDISQKDNSFEDDDDFAAKIAVAINADVMVSISKKGMLYTVDPFNSSRALPFYCYDTSRNAPFSESRKKDLSKKINAAKTVNSHTRPIPMLLTSYNAPFTISNMFSAEKINDICVNGSFPFFTILINTDKILRFSSDISLPIESRHIAGSVIVDKCAAEALSNKSSLLSVGIIKIEGTFDDKTTVSILNEDLVEIGRGVTDYSSEELQSIIDENRSVTVINRTKMRINGNSL
ncbi:MAG: PUA domain-containing protein [Acutalibacteraceae bacterium]|nr:PUA domain-containing protein [Acutalibacteraceae bacterium]